jgi:L-seryl-tRNA(Ser) seleniumtransferase
MIYARGNALEEIPVLRMLTRPAAAIQKDAQQIVDRLGAQTHAVVEPTEAHAGGGSLPTRTLLSFAVALRPDGTNPNDLARRLRIGTPSVIGRVENDAVLLDLRTVSHDQHDALIAAVNAAFST